MRAPATIATGQRGGRMAWLVRWHDGTQHREMVASEWAEAQALKEAIDRNAAEAADLRRNFGVQLRHRRRR